MKMTAIPQSDNTAEGILEYVYQALKDKGYDPVTQIVGYLISGDPTYITSYNQARSLICRVERDELMEELVRSYIENKLSK
ncbi:MAG: IreB family regulatory phosphoprotein [Eubacteriales bacterium]|nr:IreB family regulatory phosphoprotein [Eubacteriales bacterium]MDD3882411.1 IreB family regulatory phosphoprotein [Eubacteriales bacterium]MDD4512368.1 IreB family regulatory phosphoprotein [Eubacteriales bacterium]